MTKIDIGGFVTRRCTKKVYRNWYIARRVVTVGLVCVPKQYWGKHIRFKIEVDDNDHINYPPMDDIEKPKKGRRE